MKKSTSLMISHFKSYSRLSRLAYVALLIFPLKNFGSSSSSEGSATGKGRSQSSIMRSRPLSINISSSLQVPQTPAGTNRSMWPETEASRRIRQLFKTGELTDAEKEILRKEIYANVLAKPPFERTKTLRKKFIAKGVDVASYPEEFKSNVIQLQQALKDLENAQANDRERLECVVDRLHLKLYLVNVSRRDQEFNEIEKKFADGSITKDVYEREKFCFEAKKQAVNELWKQMCAEAEQRATKLGISLDSTMSERAFEVREPAQLTIVMPVAAALSPMHSQINELPSNSSAIQSSSLGQPSGPLSVFHQNNKVNIGLPEDSLSAKALIWAGNRKYITVTLGLLGGFFLIKKLLSNSITTTTKA